MLTTSTSGHRELRSCCNHLCHDVQQAVQVRDIGPHPTLFDGSNVSNPGSEYQLLQVLNGIGDQDVPSALIVTTIDEYLLATG